MDDFQTPLLSEPESTREKPVSSDPLVCEMVRRWRQGKRCTAREMLAERPDLHNQPERAVALIYEEMCLRREAGLPVKPDEVAAQFPQWRDRITLLWECHQLLDDATPGAASHSVPGRLADFVLQHELGRGSQGRVYLASQTSLAQRPVVIKSSGAHGREHLTLARLQHANIVPLHGTHEDVAAGQIFLCMPFFGGATLQQILVELTGVPHAQRSGQGLLNVLDTIQGRLPVQLPKRGPARRLLGQASYVQAVCWMGAALADALQHAHERDYVHLDIKPSNILIASDGQPMLLDFHIACQPLRADEMPAANLGGTPRYMSPEQRAAITALEVGLTVPQPVDGRSDIYSLGLVLFEALGGNIDRSAERGGAGIDVARLQVTPGLRGLITKCLAGRAEDRYPSAGTLAEDLRRFLRDEPLRGAPDRSVTERWRKWRRRHRAAFPLLMITAVLLILATLMGATAWRQIDAQHQQGWAALQEGRQQLALGRHKQAMETLQRGLAGAGAWPADSVLVESLNEELDRARHGLAAQQLHLLADRFRFLAGSGATPAGDLVDLQSSWEKMWSQRAWLLASRGQGNAATQRELEADLLDLALIWTDWRARSAKGSGAEMARQQAMQILAEAEESVGSSTILILQRQAIKQGLALKSGVKLHGPAPKSPWEYYLVGRWYLQQGQLDQAADLLDRAVELQPQNFWPNFHRGVCAYRRQDPEVALVSFQVCVALAPDKAACYYNRALVQIALGRNDDASNSCAKALELDPQFSAARQLIDQFHVKSKKP